MKTITFLLFFSFSISTLLAQDFYLNSNGVTCMCPDASVGDTGVVNGITYTKRTRQQITTENASTTCTSGITDMSYIFASFGSFNQDISSWDMSSVTNMSVMFGGDFNQPIGDWDVSSVTDMSGLIGGGDFNQPIGNWDVSSVTNMNSMFYTNLNFTQDISSWDVSSVTDMSYMFSSSNFNQPIGDWDVSSVTNMERMFWVDDFFGATVYFNQPIGDWDVSSVTNMNEMFYDAESFNQPIGDWDVSNVTIMNYMFGEAISFNQPIGDWDVSNVTNMNCMFCNTPFNQPIGDWDVSNVISMSSMFSYTTDFNQDISNWQFNADVFIGDFIEESGLDINNYDALLAAFSNQNLVDKELNAEDLIYCNVSARDDLITNKGWTIVNDSYSFPSITAPINISIDPDPSSCVATNVDLGTPTIIAECGVGSETNNAPNEFPIGQTQVVWTLVDENGFESSDTQTVTVIFNQPIITAPNNLNIDPDPSSCVAENVDLGTPTITGGCGVATISNNAPNEFPIGVTQVVWTLVDGSGIEDTDIQTVTVTLQVDVADVCYVSSDQTQVSNNRVFITNDPTNSGLNVEYYEVLREAPSGDYETIGFINPPEFLF